MTLNRIRYADHSSRQSRSTKIPAVVLACGADPWS